MFEMFPRESYIRKQCSRTGPARRCVIDQRLVFGDLSIVVFLEITTLFSVPLDPTITEGCDSGQPVVVTHPDSSQVTPKL